MAANPALLIHESVTAVARRRPDAVAVVDTDGTRIDYRTLDSAAETWAAELAGLGVRPGDLVPVRLPRSARLTAVLLAVLKCGAGYAALDPRWPAERTNRVLAQLAPPLLAGDPGDQPDGAAPPLPVWRPGTVPQAAAAGVRLTRRPAVTPDSPACVFFTSGTSGAPKGVVSPHRATTRLFGAGGPLAFGPDRVMTQAAPTPWDAWSLEQWGMLTTGGTTVVVADDYLLPEMLAAAIAGHGVNTAWLTSSVFNLFVLEDVDSFAGLRQLLVGGERLSTEYVGAFLDRHPGIEILNGYGPVETCVFATTHRITRPDCRSPYGIPIGRPVPGTEVHEIDGELCVSGTGLALRYLGDEALTADRFPVLPVDGGPPRRVYRTGDRGLRDPDGVWHFTGRSDRQVKIRGHRVEPDGIEAFANTLADVGSCAAVPIPGELGVYDRLALFYTVRSTPRPGTGPDPLAVRAALARALPPYSVPDLVRAVDALPVAANGKVDRASLVALATGP